MTGTTYFDRLTGEDARPIEELCRPLSAKVMPRIAMIGVSNILSEGEAMANQRKQGRSGKSKPAKVKK
jgi:hypothetical protein